jgi:hypothetical protein
MRYLPLVAAINIIPRGSGCLLLIYYCFTVALLLLYLLSKVEEHAKQGV